MIGEERGYLLLFGAIVRQAILDYRTRNMENEWEGARQFLYSERGLERWINDCQLPLDAGYVRGVAEGERQVGIWWRSGNYRGGIV